MSGSYVWLKAFHVAAAILFVGGVLGAALFAAATTSMAREARRDAAANISRWDREVTTPAMLATWALGLTLAIRGDWSHSGWLSAKFGLVMVVSAVHGTQSGVLRKIAGSGAPPRLRNMAPVVAICAAAIAVLVVVKPF